MGFNKLFNPDKKESPFFKPIADLRNNHECKWVVKVPNDNELTADVLYDYFTLQTFIRKDGTTETSLKKVKNANGVATTLYLMHGLDGNEICRVSLALWLTPVTYTRTTRPAVVRTVKVSPEKAGQMLMNRRKRIESPESTQANRRRYRVPEMKAAITKRYQIIHPLGAESVDLKDFPSVDLAYVFECL